MGPEVYVDGRPLTSITPSWGDLEVTHRLLGSWETKWAMGLDPVQRPAQLRADAVVEVRVGSYCIWGGDLVEPNWAEGTFAAVGACRQAEGSLALDNATGQTTSIPDKAADDAISRGALNCTRPASISTLPLGESDETDTLNYVAALLDAYVEKISTATTPARWYVDPWRALRFAFDPTAPSAYLMPDNGVLGTAVEAQVGTVVGRYIDSTSGILENVSYGDGLPEKGVSWESRGPMTAAEATDLCEGVWAPLQAQPGWTNGLTVTGGELLTPGGRAMPLWKFTAGQMLGLLAVRDLRGLSLNTNVVIGESIWTPAEDQTRLNPVGKVARDIRSLAEAGGGVLL